jgi:hypothetical protein
LATAIVSAAAANAARADGVDDATSKQIRHCLHEQAGPVEACLLPVIRACGETATASSCDYNISGEALDIAAADHPGIANAVQVLGAFIGQKCTDSVPEDSFGHLRIAEHALCVRANRFKLVEILTADH